MDRRQELQPERRLETLNKVRDAVEASVRVGVPGEKGFGLIDSARNQSQLLVWSISSVGVTRYVIPFDLLEDVAKILGVRTLRGRCEAQPQGFASLLHEVHQFVDLEQRHERIQ